MGSGRSVAFALAGLMFATRSFAQDPPASPPVDLPPPADSPASPPPAFADAPPAPAPAAIESPAVKPIRFTGTLGAISLPRLLSLELLARFRRTGDPKWDLFAVGAAVEYLPGGIANFGDKTTLSWFQVAADARYFVWRFLFVGARLGWQFSRADSEKFGSEVDYVTSSLFVAPKLGALYTFGSGFTIGGDLGATIPMFADTSITSDGTQDSNARKAAKTFGSFVMPSIGVRLGWTI